ncbi:MAG: CoA transferase, partial [Flavobacteriaceae bacterium]
FRENKDRVINRKQLDDVINAWLGERTTEEALEAFAREDVPAMKIQSIADLMKHPQVIARGNFVDIPDHDRGDVCVSAPVPRLKQMAATIRWAGQDLGEASSEILRSELGLDDDEIDGLAKRGIIKI